MQYISFEISLVALIPALALCVYVYLKDRIEKEPISLLLLLFAGGAAMYFPAHYLTRFAADGWDSLFAAHRFVSINGIVSYSSSWMEILHKTLYSVFAFALFEIIFKWLFLVLATRKTRHFNYLFDGIVYSLFISLGYAAAENLLFAWVNGWDTLALRLLESLPRHLILGVLMGYFYTMWHARFAAATREEQLVCRGVLSQKRICRVNGWLLLSLLVPFGVAGFYFLAGNFSSKAMNTVFYFVIFLLYGITFTGVDRIAAKDRSTRKFSLKLLCHAHPEVDAELLEEQMDIIAPVSAAEEALEDAVEEALEAAEDVEEAMEEVEEAAEALANEGEENE